MKLPTQYPALIVGGILGPFQTVFTSIGHMFTLIVDAINNPDSGATAARPASQLTVGQTYFDTTIDKPVWWNGTTWVDATGTPA